jgi:two-component system LytT family response regulator
VSYRVVLADDEPLARRGIRARLRRHPDLVLVRECRNGEEASAAIAELRPDLVFLDVEMPGISGLEVVRAVGEAAMPPTIFVSAYARHAVEAFGAAAVDYLVKPVEPERFERSLARARWTLEARRATGAPAPPLAAEAALVERFWVKTRTGVVLVPVEDLDWIQAEGDYARLHVGERSYLIPDSLVSLEGRLPHLRFVRIHRSTIVNLRRVVALEPRANLDHAVRLTTGALLRLSRTFYRRFAEALGSSVVRPR